VITMRRALVGWLAGLLLALAGAGHAEVAIPPVARVTDLTGTLTPDAVAALDAKAADLEVRKGSQVAVLMVPTTAPETIEQYALRVAEAWKLGRKGVDDGALLVVATQDRALRIEVGYGLEGALSDAIAKRIVSDVIVPRFKADDFAGGVTAGLDAIVGIIDGEPLPAAAPRARGGSEPGILQNLEGYFVVGFILVVVVGGILRSIIGRVPAALAVGAGAGVLGWFIASAIAVGAIVAVIAFVFTLAGGGSAMRGMRGGRGGWSGGSGGWSGGGGGGFGGGGGGFGGGGASGRW
jgi:uncharacterized protein